MPGAVSEAAPRGRRTPRHPCPCAGARTGVPAKSRSRLQLGSGLALLVEAGQKPRQHLGIEGLGQMGVHAGRNAALGVLGKGVRVRAMMGTVLASARFMARMASVASKPSMWGMCRSMSMASK